MISIIKEVYRYRQMVFSLVKRDLQGRYKGSILGFLWTFINPLLQLAVYTMVFSVIMKSEIEKYYLFLFVALVPWIFFSTSLTGGSSSVLSSAEMVKKIYFPREILPISYVTSAFVNMMLCFIVIFAVLIVTGYGCNVIALLFLPIIMIVEYILALGFALLSSALTVYFRDLTYILNILVMAWQFLTPVMYSPAQVPEKLLPIWKMNPLTPIIDAYRDVLYYKTIPNISTMTSAVLVGVTMLVVGELVFIRLQKGFAEEL